MSKKSKIWLVILTILFIVLGGLLILTNQYKSNHIEVTLPEGQLSDDLFVAQNTKYEPDKNLPLTIDLNFAPYSIDVFDSSIANVGNSNIVYIDAATNLYLSETPYEDYHSVLLQEYAKAIYLDADMATSGFLNMIEKEGYIDGFKAKFFVDKLKICNASGSREVYVPGYVLYIPEYNDYVIISVPSLMYDTTTLANCEIIAAAVLKTIQFEEERAENFVPNVVPSEELSNSESETVEQEIPVIEESPEPVIKTETQKIVIEKDFDNLTVNVSWSNPSEITDIKIWDPTNVFFHNTEKLDENGAVFKMGMCMEGEYTLEMTGPDWGEVTVTIEGE